MRMLARLPLLLLLPLVANGQGYLAAPPSRNALRIHSPPIDHCPQCGDAGGPAAVSRGAVWPRGRHGVCGDRASEHTPRDHEEGGALARSTAATRTFTSGGHIKLAVALSQSLGGRFSYRICRYRPGSAASEREALTDACLNLHQLVQADVRGAQLPGSKYFYLGTAAAQPLLVNHTFQLPAGLACDGASAKCVLQWYWQTGNSCTPPGTPGPFAATGLPTCGAPGAVYPEEFWNCADIRILPPPVAHDTGGSHSLPPPPARLAPKPSSPPPPYPLLGPPANAARPSPPPPEALLSPPAAAAASPLMPPPPAPVPPTSAPPPAAVSSEYAKVLHLSWLFYEAQRSGKLPASNRIPWRGDSHLDDAVPGGWHDAGDHLKLHLPMAVSTAFLSWGVLDFSDAYNATGETQHALDSLKTAADYLMACHYDQFQFVGQIGDPSVDHAYWGRPEEQQGARPAYVWNYSTPAADLLGAASAALSSASLVFQPSNATYAAQLLSHAGQLYSWAAAVPGKYNAAYPTPTSVYTSSRYEDKLMFAAAWMYRATGNTSYLDAAYSHWQAGDQDIFAGWDSTTAPAANLLLGLPGAAPPGADEYRAFLANTYLPSWQQATNGINKTPLGLYYPAWSQWGNLRLAANAGFMQLLYHSHTPCPACLQWAQGQADYMLGLGPGSTGRSFVVGYGVDPPVQPQHRAASCPDRPASCDWDQFSYAGPNPQTLYGGLVGGPTGLNGDAFEDLRSDYVDNEVAVDYNAGFTGLLAGLVQLL